jgi:hypothetical protein
VGPTSQGLCIVTSGGATTLASTGGSHTCRPADTTLVNRSLAIRPVPGACIGSPFARNDKEEEIHSGRSVNRNRSVRFFGYSVNSVTSEPRTDRFLRELGTEAFRFRVIRFGFGSNRKEPKFSKHKKTAHSNANFDNISSLFYAPNRDNLRSNKHKSSTTHIFRLVRLFRVPEP